MARLRMVTRTIKATEVKMVTLDLETMTPMVREVVLSIDTKNVKELEKMAKMIHESDTIKVVSVEYSQSIEKLYGMTENTFMEHAVELDPETRKLIEE